jgi:hypothetical protein
MKKFLLPLLFTIIVSCKEKQNETTHNSAVTADTVSIDAVPTDTIAAKPDADPADPFAAIRQKVERINTMKLKKEHYEFMCDEKMMVDYFYDNGEIVKIAVDFGTVGDVYAKEGYYYNKGKLIFIYEFVEGGPACEGCIKTNEYRSYISNDKTIRYLKDKAEQPCKKCEFGPSSRHYKLLPAKTKDEVKAILCP